jgi:hypothetical protein
LSNEVRQYKGLIRPATYEDCLNLAPNLRQEDKDEAWVSGRYLPEEALIECLRVTPNAKVGVVDGEVICMFGVTSALRVDTGMPWMLGSDGIKSVSREFLRRNKEALDEVSVGYTWLNNYVWSKNTTHIRWLKWMGFTIEYQSMHVGHDQEIFYRFHKHLKG